MSEFAVGVAAGIIVSVTLAVSITHELTGDAYKKEAIEIGCAAYDVKTGKWDWIKREAK